MKKSILLSLLTLSVLSNSALASEYLIRMSSPGLIPNGNSLSCQGLLNGNKNIPSGYYTINPSGQDPFQVYCDMNKATGEGWTRVGYKEDLPLISRWNSSDAWRWVPQNFGGDNFEFTQERVNQIRAVSSQAKQDLSVSCVNALIYRSANTGLFNYASGIRFDDGTETSYGVKDYNFPIKVTKDTCSRNTSTIDETIFSINYIGLPVVNIMTLDTGASHEKFGAALTSSPAWFK